MPGPVGETENLIYFPYYYLTRFGGSETTKKKYFSECEVSE